MTWISVKEKKPEHDICALVCNDNGWMAVKQAIYHADYDVWQLDNPRSADSILLDVTHYIEIPPIPRIL